MIVAVYNALKFLRHHTYGELFRRLCSAAVRPFYENTARYIVKLNLRCAAAPDPDLNTKELTIADLDKMLQIMYVSRTGLEERFSRGDRCFATIEKDKIVNSFWAQFGLNDLCELHLKFILGPTQTWMYNALTVKSARGRGLYPNIIRYMAKVLLESGIEEAFIDVDPKNISSIRGLEKAGYTRVALIRTRKVFSKLGYRLTVFDEDSWMQLSQKIENLHVVQDVMRYNS